MAYILGLVIVIILFMVLHYFTELSKKEMFITISIFLFLVFGAIYYNYIQNNQREAMLNVVISFKQGKNVTCHGDTINSKDYTISIGTYTFIGKKNTPNYGRMISVSECE
jgi:preprotein translocase subunit YajC